MATYNGEKFLRKQLDSIYAQTYKNIEVVVTDDGSRDATVEILEQYSKSHGLKYFTNNINLGFVKNFEKVMSLCNGDYIALSDQDDIWIPTKIETLVQEIDGHSLICSDAMLMNGSDKVIVKSFKDYSGRVVPFENTFQYLVFGNFVTGCTVMLDSKLLAKSLPIPSEFPFHDWWLALIATQMNGIKYLPEQLVLYRQHGENVSGAGKKISLTSFFSTVIAKQEEISMQYTLKHKRINFLLESRIYGNTEEKQFLEDALDFANLFMGQRGSFSAVFFTLRYSQSIPQVEKKWIQFLKTGFLFYKYILIESKYYIKKMWKV